MKIVVSIIGVNLILGGATAATAEGLQTSSDPSAKIEKVEFKPDKSGHYYAYVTVRNVSGKDQPFYMMMEVEDQPPQMTASGPKGQPNPIKAGGTYTFQLNTLLKKEPKNASIDVMEKLPR